MTVHAQATGIEPITGTRYSATNNPASQLWIHVTGWHSVLKCYEMYGPGPLSAVEEQRYWEECVIAAELQTCKTSDVPRSRDEVREYFAEVRPRLCTSERANRAMHYLLRTPRAQGEDEVRDIQPIGRAGHYRDFARLDANDGWVRSASVVGQSNCAPRCERQSGWVVHRRA